MNSFSLSRHRWKALSPNPWFAQYSLCFNPLRHQFSTCSRQNSGPCLVAIARAFAKGANIARRHSVSTDGGAGRLRSDNVRNRKRPMGGRSRPSQFGRQETLGPILRMTATVCKPTLRSCGPLTPRCPYRTVAKIRSCRSLRGQQGWKRPFQTAESRLAAGRLVCSGTCRSDRKLLDTAPMLGFRLISASDKCIASGRFSRFPTVQPQPCRVTLGCLGSQLAIRGNASPNIPFRYLVLWMASNFLAADY